MFGLRARFLAAFLAIATLAIIPALRQLYISRHHTSAIRQIYVESAQDVVNLQRVSALLLQIKDVLAGARRTEPGLLEELLVAVETEVSLSLNEENQSRYGDGWSAGWRAAVARLRETTIGPGRGSSQRNREIDMAIVEVDRILNRSLEQEVNEYEAGLRRILDVSQATERLQHWWTLVLAILAIGSAFLLADYFSAPLRRVLINARRKNDSGKVGDLSDNETVVSYVERLFDEKAHAERRAEAAHQIMDSMSDGVVVLDRNGFVTHCNQAMHEIVDQSEQRLGGQACIAVPELRPIALALHSRRAAEALELSEVLISRAGGKRAEFSVKVSPIITGEGQVDGCVVVLRDETIRRDLTRRVVEQQHRLESAERLAAVGTMGAIVAHKFSQPITSVRLFLQQAQRMLEPVDCPPAVRENLGASVSELSRASEMIRSVLSRGQRANSTVIEEVRIDAAIQRARAALEFRLKESGGEIQIECDPAIDCTVSGPMIQIDEIFYTLFQNSLQAARPGTVPLVMSKVSVRDEFVDIRIIDNGNGIPRDHLDQIFDSFFSTKTDGEGVGLGLAIVQQVVKSLGGSIEVNSTVGVGTTFHVAVPRNRNPKNKGEESYG